MCEDCQNISPAWHQRPRIEMDASAGEMDQLLERLRIIERSRAKLLERETIVRSRIQVLSSAHPKASEGKSHE